MAAQPQTVSVFVNKIGQDLFSFPKDKKHGTSPAHSPSPQEKVALALLYIRYNLALFSPGLIKHFLRKLMGWKLTHVFGPVAVKSFDVTTQTQDSRREIIKKALWPVEYWCVT